MKMHELSEAGDLDIRPDSYSFSSVINCWARSDDQYSAQRAERILDLMESRSAGGDEHLQANRFTYGAVLNAWARSGHVDAPRKALDILHKMEEKYENGNADMSPSGPIFNAGEIATCIGLSSAHAIFRCH